MSKFERYITTLSREQKRKAIRNRLKFAKHWVREVTLRLDRELVARELCIAESRGLTFGEHILRGVERGQPRPLC